MNFWTFAGFALLGWVAYDLYAGVTVIWDVIYKDQQPGLYWTAVSIWALLGISCFFSWE